MRGGGSVSRKVAQEAAGGKPLPPDLEQYVHRLRNYSESMLLQSRVLAHDGGPGVRLTRAQVKVWSLERTQTLTLA